MKRWIWVVLGIVVAALVVGYLAPVVVILSANAASDVSPPSLIMESGSMMHKECAPGEAPPRCDASVGFGRRGTLDPGDIAVIHSVAGPEDVETLVEGGAVHHGLPGDVIVYYRAGDRSNTPILHRAVAYVEVEGTGDEARYAVRWGERACEGGATKTERDGHAWCVYGAEGITIPSVPVQGAGSTPAKPNPYRPVRSGFLTKGDNPSTNPVIDQQTGLSVDERGIPAPVQVAWIEGKVVREVPWYGLAKLMRADTPNEVNPPSAWKKVGNAYAPSDLWTMYFIVTWAPFAVGALLGAGAALFFTRRPRA